MNRIKRTIVFLAALCLLLSACTSTAATSSSSAPSSSVESGTQLSATTQNRAALDDLYVAPKTENVITLSESGASYNGTGGVNINGGIVTISAPGTYTVEGTLASGQIVVTTEQKGTVNLVLNGVSLSNTEEPAIWVKQADQTVISLADGTQNVLTSAVNAQTDETDAAKAALFASDDLWLCGDGTLQIQAENGNGIQCKDTLTLAAGTYEITAGNNAIVCKDSVTIGDGIYTLQAGNDGIKSTNTEDTALGTITVLGGTFSISAESDALQAERILEIADGTFDLTTGGGAANAAVHTQNEFFGKGGMMQPMAEGEAPTGTPPELPSGEAPVGTPPDTMPATNGTNTVQPAASTATAPGTASASTSTEETVSRKALKGGTAVNISGGNFTIDACDDAVHSNGNVQISGGTFVISTGDDGFHADESLTVSGGEIDITNSYEGLEAYTIVISAGDISVVSSDDGINAAGGDGSGQYGFAQDTVRGSTSGGAHLSISGGTIVVDASGDGIDVNGNAEMTGGTVVVHGPTSGGNGALDYDGTFAVNGGTLTTFGSAQMAMTPSADSTLPVISVYGTISAGQTVTVQTKDGSVIATMTTQKETQNITFTSDALSVGDTVTIQADDTSLGEATLAAGVNTIGTQTGGTGNMGGMRGNGGTRPEGSRPTQSNAASSTTGEASTANSI